MQESLPLVSIIITSYNRAHLISKAIESALAQDYSNLEIIISDNCSTDDTDTVIRKYTGDPRVKYSRNAENIGMIPNFRKATYELSKGEYITYVSSDDYLLDNTFVTDSIRLVNKYDNVVLVYGKMHGLNTENGILWKMPEEPYFGKEIWEGKNLFFKSSEGYLLSWGACLMKREAVMAVKGLISDYLCADIDTNYKMMMDGNICFLNRFCYLHLGHAGNNGFPTDSKKILSIMDCYESVAKYALNKMPEEAAGIKKWEKHFLYFTVKWAFHHLKAKNETQYKLFKQDVKKTYPAEYRRFITSRSYMSVLFQPVKKMLPKKFIDLVKKRNG
jgi:glycosyltransferase involved in cell wall biosynthesis